MTESDKYWPRLQSQQQKLSFVKTDFARWKDEDSDDEDERNPQAQLNEQMMFQQMLAQQGGMAGMDPNNIPNLNSNEQVKYLIGGRFR